MKKVLMFCCYFEPIITARGYIAYKYFSSNYETKLVYSSYSHIHKKFVTHDNIDFLPIKCVKYRKNISFLRILSYFVYAFKTRKLICEYDPDFVYIQLPPNSAAYFLSKRASMMGIPVIIDILDLWPESLPIKHLTKMFYFTIGNIWKMFRTKTLKYADMIISESQYFLDQLNINHLPHKVIYLSKDCKTEISDIRIKSEEPIVITFLGSINSISDFEVLIKLSLILKSKGRKVQLKVVGDGINRAKLLKTLQENAIDYIYYGKVFDESEKEGIMRNSWFGFNGYKVNTEVALSYKSIDYLSFSLPLISNVKSDTWELIQKYKIGLNYDGDSIDELAETIDKLSIDEVMEMKKNSFAVFNKFFSFDVFKRNMDDILKYDKRFKESDFLSGDFNGRNSFGEL